MSPEDPTDRTDLPHDKAADPSDGTTGDAEPRRAESPAPHPKPDDSWLSDQELHHLNELIGMLDRLVPERHQEVVLHHALARALAPAAGTDGPTEESSGEAAGDVVERPSKERDPGDRSPPKAATPGGEDLSLAAYAALLAEPGKTLLKGLVALEVAEKQLGIGWMTPAEIESLLRRRGRVTIIYRTNVSNTLRDARGLTDRRRRGRAYEYRITDAGRHHLRRALALGNY